MPEDPRNVPRVALKPSRSFANQIWKSISTMIGDIQDLDGFGTPNPSKSGTLSIIIENHWFSDLVCKRSGGLHSQSEYISRALRHVFRFQTIKIHPFLHHPTIGRCQVHRVPSDQKYHRWYLWSDGNRWLGTDGSWDDEGTDGFFIVWNRNTCLGALEMYSGWLWSPPERLQPKSENQWFSMMMGDIPDLMDLEW